MKKISFYIFFVLVIISCDRSKITNSDQYSKEFNKILSNYDMDGTILIYEPATKTYYSNDFEAAKKGHLPASTFKIPNTIIALETNTVKGDTAIFKWDGNKRDRAIWEKDLTLKEAFAASCVPCYQEIARKVGVEKMKTYINKLHYNGMDINKSNLETFWLTGNSKISAFEQIDFLERFYSKKLGILNSTQETVKNIMLNEDNTKYKLYAKTGWSRDNALNNGWFVGFLESNDKVYYFALNASPKDQTKTDQFLKGRKSSIMDALYTMRIL